MKKLVTVAAGVATAMSGAGFAAEFDNPTASLYYKLPFGGASHQRESSYGFAVNYDISAGSFGNRNPLHRTLIDFRFQNQQLQDMRFHGVTLLARDKQTNELNIGGTELSNEQAIALGAVVIGGVLCATETWICEDDDNPPPPAEPT